MLALLATVVLSQPDSMTSTTTTTSTNDMTSTNTTTSTNNMTSTTRPPNMIWLQTDSMDGRLLDPTSTYYNKLKMHGIKNDLAANGAVFSRHYCASPQCVPSRASLMTGRYVHEIDAANNNQGIARSTKTGMLDSSCVKNWNATTCGRFAAAQNVTFNLLGLLESRGYELQLFGRFDVGLGVRDDYTSELWGDEFGGGFHGGPSLNVLARGANIPGNTKKEPLSTTDAQVPDPYKNDVAVGDKVMRFLRNRNPAAAVPYFLWMGLFAPHPPYHTDARYLRHVNLDQVDSPAACTVDRASMHPYDVEMSTLKNCWARNYSVPELKLMRSSVTSMPRSQTPEWRIGPHSNRGPAMRSAPCSPASLLLACHDGSDCPDA